MKAACFDSFSVQLNDSLTNFKSKYTGWIFVKFRKNCRLPSEAKKTKCPLKLKFWLFGNYYSTFWINRCTVNMKYKKIDTVVNFTMTSWWHKQVEVSTLFVHDIQWLRFNTCRAVSHNRLRDQEAHEKSNHVSRRAASCQKVLRIETTCGMPFIAIRWYLCD